MAKIKPYFIGALVGLLVGAACVFAVARSNQSKLDRIIDDIKTSLGSALLDSGDIAESIRHIRSELDGASATIDRQGETISDQERIIEAQQRGLEEIKRGLEGTGGDIRKTIRVFADGFKRLYKIYNQGGE